MTGLVKWTVAARKQWTCIKPIMASIDGGRWWRNCCDVLNEGDEKWDEMAILME